MKFICYPFVHLFVRNIFLICLFYNFIEHEFNNFYLAKKFNFKIDLYFLICIVILLVCDDNAWGWGNLIICSPFCHNHILLYHIIYIICTPHIEYNTNIRTPMANIDYPTRLGHQKAIQVDQYGLTLPIILSKLF